MKMRKLLMTMMPLMAQKTKVMMSSTTLMMMTYTIFNFHQVVMAVLNLVSITIKQSNSKIDQTTSSWKRKNL